MEQKGDDLVLRFANKKQIEGLALSESFDLQKLAELQSKLEEANIRIDEAQLKIKSRKFVFSGEVYIRQ